MRDKLIRKGLVVGIILLFIGVGFASSTQLKNNHISLMSGKTIYVDDDNTEGPWDGTIEHPYQHIQDGVNNSIDGDTVFVYNGTYYERVRVQNSINLMGEDKYTTIIDKSGDGSVVGLRNSINISGFTITNSSDAGIFTNSDNIIIYNNIISNNRVGIDRSLRYRNHIYANNIIENNDCGITTYCLLTGQFIGNIIKNNFFGLDLEYAGGEGFFISLNSFENNRLAVWSNFCENCLFTKNNFIRNIRAVASTTCTHKWDSNYWGRPMIFPKIIMGWKFGGYIIPPTPDGDGGIGWSYPYPMFDWHPAQKPYVITTTQGCDID